MILDRIPVVFVLAPALILILFLCATNSKDGEGY